MEVIGKIIVALPEQSGISKAGNSWKKKEYVLETQETYPKKVHFDFFGDRADQFPLEVGQTIRLSFDIESREYNGKWYTSIRGWKSEPYDPNAAAVQAAPAQASAQAPYPGAPQTFAAPQQSYPGAVPPPPVPTTSEPTDDLPF